jgi:hypothetical protein
LGAATVLVVAAVAAVAAVVEKEAKEAKEEMEEMEAVEAEAEAGADGLVLGQACRSPTSSPQRLQHKSRR